MTSPTGWERRLGVRHQLVPVTVRWHLESPTGTPMEGRMTDLSVSGARVVAPVCPDIVVGTFVAVSYEGHAGHVMVHRIEPTSDPDMWMYGVELIDTDPALPQVLYPLLDDAEAAERQGLWNGRYVD